MFNFNNRTTQFIIIILVIMAIRDYATEPTALLALLLTIPGVLIAITFHEFAHAYAADRLGDDTPSLQGRLSLNPLKHLDPIGSLLLLVAGFGWGKPVEVNPRNYNRTMSMEKADAIVSIAGPLMNFVLSIVFTIILCLVLKFTGISYDSLYSGGIDQTLNIILEMIFYAISINVGLGVFNLIPLPPLDGSTIIKPFLPYNAKVWFENNSFIFEIIFMVIWIFGIASIIISPIIEGITGLLLTVGLGIFGI